MRSLLFKDITIPVAFKTIPYSRRAQLWNRQASIVADLTMLAFRHGWHWVPISACDAFRKLVGGNRGAAIRPPIALLITGQATTASKSQVI
jgi:hypothetical protein